MFYRTKDAYVSEVGILCGEQETLPYYGEEITEEEYNEIIERFTKKIEEPNNDYGIPNDIYNAIIDDYTNELFEMGVL